MSAYPKIKFVYSLPYSRMLAEYENKLFDDIKEYKEIKRYIKKFQLKWEGINNPVCRILSEIIGNKWRSEEMQCYVVKYCSHTGISRPLTVRMDPDFDYVFDTLIHELIHILISYNLDKYKKIEKKLKKHFSKENRGTILHIYIIFLELQTLKRLFRQSFIDKIIKRGLKFKRIGRSWEIVLKEEDYLNKLCKI